MEEGNRRQDSDGTRGPHRVVDRSSDAGVRPRGRRWHREPDSTAVTAYDFEHSSYSVPIGFGVGQVVPRAKTIFNVSIEPQVSVADKGAGWPKWQVFVGLNTQFK